MLNAAAVFLLCTPVTASIKPFGLSHLTNLCAWCNIVIYGIFFAVRNLM